MSSTIQKRAVRGTRTSLAGCYCYGGHFESELPQFFIKLPQFFIKLPQFFIAIKNCGSFYKKLWEFFCQYSPKW